MTSPSNIIYFDGVCNLCNGFIDFLIRRDKKAKFYYAPLQGDSAGENLPNHLGNKMKSIIYFNEGKYSSRSKAVLNILYDLGGLWKATIILKIIPSFIANWVYDFIAHNRYKWFGKRDTCRIPSESERVRFVD